MDYYLNNRNLTTKNCIKYSTVKKGIKQTIVLIKIFLMPYRLSNEKVLH